MKHIIPCAFIIMALFLAFFVTDTHAQTVKRAGTNLKELVRQKPKKPSQQDTIIHWPQDSTAVVPVAVDDPVMPQKPGNQPASGRTAGKEESAVVTSRLPLQAENRAPQGKVGNKNIEAVQNTDTLEDYAYRDAMVSYYRYIKHQNDGSSAVYDSITSHNKWALHNQEAVISGQQAKGTVIFVLVLVLVASGLIFSAIQFYIALKTVQKKHELTKKAVEGAVSQTPNPLLEQNTEGDTPLGVVTTIKASLQGVEISSSILGLLVLIISLAFFYLYLTRVYPVVAEKFVQTEEVAPR